MTRTNQYDALNRLTALGSLVAGGETVGFAYGYTPANQRQAVTNADGSYWVYAYDALGQVTAGTKHWPDGTLVPAQQFSYSFDDIGNRQTTKTGGDANGHKLRTATYTANDLNQYTQRTVPGYADVAGSASTDATVTVNNQPTHRRGEYYRAELAVTNETGPLHLALTNVGVINQGTNADLVATNLGHVLIPPTPETFTNDADGNLIADGLWTSECDGENRLIHMLSRTELPETARTDLHFTYDHQGRRISKTVSNWISGNSSLITDHRFLYDGWNLLAALAADLSPLTSFTWGLDASGTEQGAGGVGGLLAITVHTGTNAGTYFPCYDANHNVMALVNAASGDLAAQYEYGPFHEVRRATGLLARGNPFLAATKQHDWETTLYYYGFRYYDAIAGRWLCKDPIGENGGPNVVAFLGNHPPSKWDVCGLFPFCSTCDKVGEIRTTKLESLIGPPDKTPEYMKKWKEALHGIEKWETIVNFIEMCEGKLNVVLPKPKLGDDTLAAILAHQEANLFVRISYKVCQDAGPRFWIAGDRILKWEKAQTGWVPSKRNTCLTGDLATADVDQVWSETLLDLKDKWASPGE